MNICMIGAGYVGLVSAACFSEFGWNVVCVDKMKDRVDALKRGERPAHGPQNGRLHSAPAGKRTTLNDAPTPPPRQDLAAAKAAAPKT